MAVNNNFYAAINALVAKATGGTTAVITDYSSFIDAGKIITNITYTDLQNNFIAALMNRIALSINTARGYDGAYRELERGTLEYGNTIELIINKFYEAQAAPFVALADGYSVDQYVVAKPDVAANYYTKTDAYQIVITVQYDQLKKAWESPASMDSFIQGVIMYVMNSNELRREAGRIALVADLIVRDLGETAAATIDTPAQVYKLLTLYNAIAGVSLTADEALYNEEFIRFAVKTINMVAEKTKKVSKSYNNDAIMTFTRPEDRHLFVNSALVSALGAYVFPNSYNKDDQITLNDYINVPYWQAEDHPFTVKYADPTDGARELTTDPVLAVMCDRYAVGEYVRKQDMRSSPFNAAGEYFNNFLNVEVAYVSCPSANSVVFTLA